MTRRLTAFVKLILLLLALASPILTFQSYLREREFLSYREEIIASHAGERHRIVGDLAQRYFSESPHLSSARLRRLLPSGPFEGLAELPPPEHFLGWTRLRQGPVSDAEPRLLALLHDDEAFPSGVPRRFAGLVELIRAGEVMLSADDFARLYQVAGSFWRGEDMDDATYAFLLEKLPLDTRCRFESQLAFLGQELPDGSHGELVRLESAGYAYLLALQEGELAELNERLAAFSPGLHLIPGKHWSRFEPVSATFTVQLTDPSLPRKSVALRFLYFGLVLELVIAFVYLVLTRYEKVHETQKRLLATTSHELRTPLAVIRQFAEMLVDRSAQVPERIGNYHRHILRESVKMQFLVENLLSASRFENLKMEANPERIELATWLEELRESAARLSEHEIRLSCPDVVVQWDRTLMAQVLTNLMENARIHAGTDMDITVEVQGARVVIDCRDFGQAPDLRDLAVIRAFKSSGRRGLGLGLYLSQRILALHRGTLRFADAAPGLRVTVELPMVVEVPPKAAKELK